MRQLAAIGDAGVARRIVECLGLPARDPPMAAPPGATADSGHGSWDEEFHWEFNQAPPGG